MSGLPHLAAHEYSEESASASPDETTQGERNCATSTLKTSAEARPSAWHSPGDADVKIKFLAAVSLRGFGGIVFDAHCNRVTDYLGRRDHVSGDVGKGQTSIPPRSEQGWL